jgi:hypothetical protein
VSKFIGWGWWPTSKSRDHRTSAFFARVAVHDNKADHQFSVSRLTFARATTGRPGEQDIARRDSVSGVQGCVGELRLLGQAVLQFADLDDRLLLEFFFVFTIILLIFF